MCNAADIGLRDERSHRDTTRWGRSSPFHRSSIRFWFQMKKFPKLVLVGLFPRRLRSSELFGSTEGRLSLFFLDSVLSHTEMSLNIESSII